VEMVRKCASTGELGARGVAARDVVELDGRVLGAALVEH